MTLDWSHDGRQSTKQGEELLCTLYVFYLFNINLRASPESLASIFGFLFRNTWPKAHWVLFGGGGVVLYCCMLRSFWGLSLQHDTHSFQLHLYSKDTPVSKRIERAWPALPDSCNLFLVRGCSLMPSK